VAAANYARLDIANTFAADQTLNAALNLAQTTGADVGVINLGGNPLIHACCPNSTQNTFVGTSAGNFTADATASGGYGANTATGYQALQALTSGAYNTANGTRALYLNTTGYSNTASGDQALYSNTTGYSNTASGSYALEVNSTGFANTANGYGALNGNKTGRYNVAVGASTGGNLNAGSSNIMLGYLAGQNFASSESNNIDIGNPGVAADSGVIRIGTGGTQTQTFIAGITGVTPGGASPLPVIIDGNGQLGTGTSASGTVTSVTAGAGLTASPSNPITTTGTLSLASASCGAGKAAVALPLACSPFATLGANTFVGDQGITGNISLTKALSLPSTTNSATGVINLGSYQFAHNFGTQNTFVGQEAGNFSMTGANNAAVGYEALASNTTGNDNTASGDSALLISTSGNDNTAIGFSSLFTNNGNNNTSVGSYALTLNSTGNNNTASGYDALGANNSGTGNTAIGNNAGVNLGTSTQAGGSENIMVGDNAGGNFNADESNNIDIGNQGVPGDSGVIRIGTVGIHAGTFIAGISGFNIGSGSAVLINSIGQLGTVQSSRRYKEDIHDMGATSDGLLRLRPVTFRYKKPYNDGSKPIQYGLIAEEVNEVYPDLVVRNKDGQVETVQYYKLDAMLLNEVQKLAKAHAADQAEIAKLQLQIAEERKERQAQQAELSQVLAQVRVIQAALAGKSATRPRIRAAKNAAVPAKTPTAAPPNAKAAVNQLVAKVSF
jgi:hypothetical protein